MSVRCLMTGHDWSNITWPIGVAWCHRCGKRWPA
jgi:hypothetical protein